ncbi:MAG: glycoside hydrolase family 24 [Ponticaulis sp.]|nr:glycoside hydrolase family 24 [Ponticaulis sp.]
MIEIADVRFELPLGFQTSGGPEWRSEIVTLASGGEVRNALWSRPLRRWQVMGVPLNASDAWDLFRFFNARSGAHQGFRFRDPFNWKTNLDEVTPFDQAIGTGDGVTTDFQLVFDDGGSAPLIVTRPVTESVQIGVDGSEASGFSVNGEAGVVSFTMPPADGAVLTAGFEFDLPVRFETDRLELGQPTPGSFQLTRLALVEIREV